MKTHKIEVFETVKKRRVYIIKAKTKDEANEKALKGETHFEFDVETVEVVARELV